MTWRSITCVAGALILAALAGEISGRIRPGLAAPRTAPGAAPAVTGDRSSASRPGKTAMAYTRLARARLGKDLVELYAGPGRSRRLLVRRASTATVDLDCGPLDGAHGLWATDVDGDGRPDLVVALRRKARFDPVVASRLHVYTLIADRCVPLWRGTRLAGRFSRVRPEGSLLFALESVGNGAERLARYRWSGFGYSLSTVLWQGRGDPPAALARRHLGAPAPRPGAP